MASGLPRTVWLNSHNGQHTLDLSLTTHKMAMFNSTYISGVNFDTAAGWSSTNEVTGTNWVTTGYTLATVQNSATINPTWTGVAGGIVRYDMDDLARTSTTITNSRGVQIYADAVTTPTADPIFVIVDFGADYSTTNGTFGITWSANGVFELDLS
jgi:hypothetical protein